MKEKYNDKEPTKDKGTEKEKGGKGNHPIEIQRERNKQNKLEEGEKEEER